MMQRTKNRTLILYVFLRNSKTVQWYMITLIIKKTWDYANVWLICFLGKKNRLDRLYIVEKSARISFQCKCLTYVCVSVAVFYVFDNEKINYWSKKTRLKWLIKSFFYLTKKAVPLQIHPYQSFHIHFLILLFSLASLRHLEDID